MSAYVIRQGDLYWRTNSCGYTRSLLDAGIYDEDEALRIARGGRTPPDRAIPITAEMVAKLEAEVFKAQENLELFRATLPCPHCRQEVRGVHWCAASEPPYTGLDDGPPQAVQCHRLREAGRR